MKFRKRPIIIEAECLDATNIQRLSEWCGGMGRPWSGDIFIPTPEGVMLAKVGDWIIKGVQGEFYPCKPDVFTATYEEALWHRGLQRKSRRRSSKTG